MSIINQLLQDLERRRASSAERKALPNQARALPPPAAPNHALWWIAGVAVVGLIVAIVWQAPRFLDRLSQTQTPAPAAKVPPRAVPAADSGITPMPRMALELALPPGVAESETPPPLPPSVKVAQSSSRRSSMPAVKPQPEPQFTTTSAATSPHGAVVSEGDGVKSITLGGAKSVPSDQIEKQVHALTPQQLAENDYRHAVELMDQERLPEAQSALESALKLNPAHIGARQGLFGLLLAAKKNAAAEQVLQDGLVLDPNQPGFALALARLQAERGDTAAAIATMQKSEAAGRGSPDYMATLAALLQRAGRHAEAVDHYQSALKLNPQSGVWWMGLGISLQALDRKADARDAFARAQASNTLTPELQAFVGQRLRQLQ